jgi:arylsulfatase
VPAFTNKPLQRDALYWEHEGNAAVRVGDYKLVRKGGGGAWELYDLAKDRTELNDLAGQMPDKAKELAAKWNAWAERCNVLEKKAAGTEDAPPKKKKKAKA